MEHAHAPNLFAISLQEVINLCSISIRPRAKSCSTNFKSPSQGQGIQCTVCLEGSHSNVECTVTCCICKLWQETLCVARTTCYHAKPHQSIMSFQWRSHPQPTHGSRQRLPYIQANIGSTHNQLINMNRTIDQLLILGSMRSAILSPRTLDTIIGLLLF